LICSELRGCAELEYKDLEPGKWSSTAGFEGLEAARPEIAEARARAG
jgi:inorganic pyrophosphatase